MTNTDTNPNPGESHEPNLPPKSPTHRDQDLEKGAKEDDRPGPAGSNAPGLDENGMPADEAKIAQDAEGARIDNSQG